jgi:PII-like signaling protein
MEWEKATRLRIYVGAKDQYRGEPLAHALVRSAHRQGMAGATIVRGIEGYGAHSRIHALQPFSLSADLPVLIEIIDHAERVEAFLREVAPLLGEGLVTREPVDVHFYRRAREGHPHRL